MTNKKTFKVTRDDDGIRLDKWVKRHRPDIPHGLLQKLLRKGAVRLDGKKAESNTRLSAGQEISFPEVKKVETSDYERKPKEIPFEEAERLLIKNILYKDENMFIINKPAGLATQGGTGVKRSVDGMLEHLKMGNKERPKLVHRLDKDTSGILVIARSAKAATVLGELFKSRDVQKTYWAIVVGTPKPFNGKIDLPLVAKKEEGKIEKAAVDEKNGKRATTFYEVLDNASSKAAWVLLTPVTGRMHQLRVHMQAIGHPILGDGKYGGRAAFIRGLPEQMQLHARSIVFPDVFGKTVSAEAPLPPHMKTTFHTLGFEESAARV